jgi:hypothetical protein
MRRSVIAAALLAAGCGRLQFDAVPLDSGDGDSGDDAGFGDGAQASCGGPTTLFCDGFEDPALGAWSSGWGDHQQTTQLARTGTGSLRARSDGVMAGAAASAALPPLTGGGLHARGWFYVPSDFAITKFNLFELYGQAPGVMALLEQGMLNAYLANPPAQTIASGMAMPLDQWVCIELDLAVGDTGGIVVLSMNGTQIGSLVGVDTAPPGGYDVVTAGMPFAAPGQQLGTVFVDDVKVMTQPVFCN